MSDEKLTIPTEETPGISMRFGFRWWICAALFLATTVNYMDRQVLGVLKPTLQGDLHWNEIDYSNVVFWFQVAYAAGYLLSGRMFDRIGLRIGYSLTIGLWSLASMAHGLARSLFGFEAARFTLGFAEGGNFPASIKTVGQWFPIKERSLATGIFNAGASVGTVLTPLLIPWITLRFGWQFAFVFTGILGFVVLLPWLILYQDPATHPRLSQAERAYITSDVPFSTHSISWIGLLRYRTTWAVAIGMACTAPIWWFFLYWVPGFLHDRHHLDLSTIGPPLVGIYLLSDIGSVFGGWISSRLIHLGWSVNASRKTALLVCALLVAPVVLASKVSGTWTAVLLLGLATAGHQGFSANLFTLVSDTMPPECVSSVVGIGGMSASIVAMFFSKFIGYVLTLTKSYLLLFWIAGLAYLFALLVIQILLPNLETAKAQNADAAINEAKDKIYPNSEAGGKA